MIKGREISFGKTEQMDDYIDECVDMLVKDIIDNKDDEDEITEKIYGEVDQTFIYESDFGFLLGNRKYTDIDEVENLVKENGHSLRSAILYNFIEQYVEPRVLEILEDKRKELKKERGQ
ncbi:MAG: hypothetical protein ACRCUM_03985 [Mycoplasmoidaceae bacterium]